MSNENGMTDREAVVDAIIRFVDSLDYADEDLLASCLTDDTVVDLTAFQAVGLNYPAFKGKETVVKTMMEHVGKPLDTTHQASNFRTRLDGDSATLTCSILAQHFRKGEGPPADEEFQQNFWNGNRYKASIVRDGAVWRIKELQITPAWSLGNREVIRRQEH